MLLGSEAELVTVPNAELVGVVLGAAKTGWFSVLKWRWRDWLIDAFNRNQHFDQFTIEQIAGDLLPNSSCAQRIATGFNRNHRGNTEDGIVPEEYAVEYVVDRVETTSTVFLGVTLGCARCHNHKYDPFTQKEFYQVFAYFNNVPENGRAIKYGNSPPLQPAPTDAQQRALNDLETRIRQEQQILSGVGEADHLTDQFSRGCRTRSKAAVTPCCWIRARCKKNWSAGSRPSW